MSNSADVIIIGAGVHGASLAFHLAQRGVQTLVLDKAYMASGASGRSSGLVRMHYDLEPESRLAWASFAYFSNWSEKRFRDTLHRPMPGEFKLNTALFGTSPGPATNLTEPFLTPDGLLAYKNGLKAILKQLPDLKGTCQDNGRIDKIEKSIIYTLTLINTIGYCRKQDKIWRD